jgi:hypothetical protein
VVIRITDNVQIISQYGIAGEMAKDNYFSLRPPYWEETFPTYADFLIKYGLSPICELLKSPFHEEKFAIFLRTDSTGSIITTLAKEQELEKTLFRLARFSRSAFRVQYALGALGYHLSSLAKGSG